MCYFTAMKHQRLTNGGKKVKLDKKGGEFKGIQILSFHPHEINNPPQYLMVKELDDYEPNVLCLKVVEFSFEYPASFPRPPKGPLNNTTEEEYDETTQYRILEHIYKKPPKCTCNSRKPKKNEKFSISRFFSNFFNCFPVK